MSLIKGEPGQFRRTLFKLVTRIHHGISRATISPVMPGGHLATSLALGGAAYASSGSLDAAVGCFAGGFLIDVDHYLDYLIFEKQWRRPSPIRFLSYYFANSPKRLVLPLHSLELMSVLLAIILVHPIPWLIGYWFGALMHLIFDVMVNGDYALKRPVLFYIFTYRARLRFAADELLDVSTAAAAGRTPIREFFSWYPLVAETDGGFGDAPGPANPDLKPFHVEVDHWRNVEGQKLGNDETAHDCKP